MAQADEAISAIRAPVTGGRATQTSNFGRTPLENLAPPGRHPPPPIPDKTRSLSNWPAHPSRMPGLTAVAVVSADTPLSLDRVSAPKRALAVRMESADVGLGGTGLTGRGA
jgi:hypothetical protein